MAEPADPHKEAMVAVARGLLVGIDDLVAGRPFTGQGGLAAPRLERSITSKARPGPLDHIPQLLRHMLSEQAQQVAAPQQESSSGSGSVSQLSEEESADGFLEWTPADLVAEEGNDESELEEALAAQGKTEALLQRFRVEERLEILEEVAAWHKSRLSEAHDTELDSQRDAEQQAQCTQAEALLEEVEVREIEALVKVHSFAHRLRVLGGEEEEEEAEPTERRAKIQKRIQAVRRLLSDAPNSSAMEQLSSETLQILAAQQAELAAIAASNAAAKQRLQALTACRSVASSMSADDLSKQELLSEELLEARREVLRAKLRARMEADAAFCRAVWKVLPSSLRNGDFTPAEAEKRKLELACARLDGEVERLGALRDAGEVCDEVLEALAMASEENVEGIAFFQQPAEDDGFSSDSDDVPLAELRRKSLEGRRRRRGLTPRAPAGAAPARRRSSLKARKPLLEEEEIEMLSKRRGSQGAVATLAAAHAKEAAAKKPQMEEEVKRLQQDNEKMMQRLEFLDRRLASAQAAS